MKKALHRICSALLVLVSCALAAELALLLYIEFLHPRYALVTPARHHVLLIGDCITNNMTPYVRRRLGADYVVTRLGTTADSTNIAAWTNWILYQKPDVLYASIGQREIAQNHRPAGVFEQNVDGFLRILRNKKYAGRIIWGGLNPVIDEQVLRISAGWHQGGFRNADVEAYNKATAQLMCKHGAEWLDMNPVFGDARGRYLQRDGFHPNERGLDAMAERLAGAVKALR